MESAIIAHDENHVYLRKPAGLPVFPVPGSNLPTLLDVYAMALKTVVAPSSFAEPALKGNFPPGFELGIGHRLDTATSGIIVAAKTVAALAALRSQFAAKEIRKFYLFKSSAPRPNWPAGQKVCTLPIAHHKSDKRKMVVGPPVLLDAVTNQPKLPEKDVPHKGRWHSAFTIFKPLPPTSPILPSLVPETAAQNRVLADPLLVQSIREHQKRLEDNSRKLAERRSDARVIPTHFSANAFSSVRFADLEGYYTAEMRTGVTHQLRIHAMACGIPIHGDHLYDPEIRRLKAMGVDVAKESFLLHCYMMEGKGWKSPLLPVDGKKIELSGTQEEK